MADKSLDEVMENIPKEDRYVWRYSAICDCIGAANCTGGLRMNGYTKNDWEIWVQKNPEN